MALSPGQLRYLFGPGGPFHRGAAAGPSAGTGGPSPKDAAALPAKTPHRRDLKAAAGATVAAAALPIAAGSTAARARDLDARLWRMRNKATLHQIKIGLRAKTPPAPSGPAARGLKIQALARRGATAGERAAAQHQLEQHLVRHGLSASALEAAGDAARSQADAGASMRAVGARFVRYGGKLAKLAATRNRRATVTLGAAAALGAGAAVYQTVHARREAIAAARARPAQR